MSSKKLQVLEVKIDKLIHGGQGIGTLKSGKKALIWGALPNETVTFKVTKKRSDYVEGVIESIIDASKNRIKAKDPEYLSTSPWQVLDYAYENEQKLKILTETFNRAGVDYEKVIDWTALKVPFNYRNKMEYSFFGDEKGLHLALFSRGSHHKQIIDGSSIARAEINESAKKVCDVLNSKNVRASDLKSIILRCNSNGEVVVALFTKDSSFPKFKELENIVKGLVVVYSNPRSSASVRTEDLYSYGDISLSEEILGISLKYDVFSFFQINIEIFTSVLSDIKNEVSGKKLIDLYAGVGSIGLILGKATAVIESDKNNINWAKVNAIGTKTKVIHSTSELALDYITNKDILAVDPPRAGLHKDLVSRILEVKPPKVVYLSCNPSTQARDLNLLQKEYKVQKIIGYNFFPRTPHIESLAIMIRI